MCGDAVDLLDCPYVVGAACNVWVGMYTAACIYMSLHHYLLSYCTSPCCPPPHPLLLLLLLMLRACLACTLLHATLLSFLSLWPCHRTPTCMAHQCHRTAKCIASPAPPTVLHWPMMPASAHVVDVAPAAGMPCTNGDHCWLVHYPQIPPPVLKAHACARIVLHLLLLQLIRVPLWAAGGA